MEKAKPNDVEAYLVNASPEARLIMEELRKIIKSTIPKAEEGISWNVPIYKYHGILAGFSVARHHVSFGVDTLQSDERKILEGKGYKTGKKTIQIKFGQKVPKTMIQKTLMAQAKINEIK